jgi:hypothetical protein
MRVKNIGSNMTEVETAKATILVSYETPVAACMNDGTGFIKTDCRWSQTTTRHINKWLDGRGAVEVEQSVLDNLL